MINLKFNDVNLVVLTGKLISDPQLNTLQSGKKFTKFRISTTSYGFSTNKEYNLFFDVVVWTANAEIIANTFTKGDRVLVKGSLSVNSYEDPKDSSRKITTYQIKASEVVSLCDDNMSLKDTSKEDVKLPGNIEEINLTDEDKEEPELPKMNDLF